MKTSRLIGLLAFSLVLPACDDDDSGGDDASVDSGAATDGDDGDDDDDDDAPVDSGAATDDGDNNDDSNLCNPEDLHDTICECTAGEQEACDGGGVRFCFWVDFQVSAHQIWGPCGECVPGQSEDCEEEGLVRTCDAVELYYDELPEDAPAFGECMPAE